MSDDLINVMRSSVRTDPTKVWEAPSTIIASRTELVELRHRLFRVFSRLGREEYSFQLTNKSEHENQRLTTLLNSYARACGCTTGAFLMAMSSMGFVLYYFLFAHGTLASARLVDWLWLTALAAAGAIVGKCIGLLYGRWRMIRLVTDAISMGNRLGNEIQS